MPNTQSNHGFNTVNESSLPQRKSKALRQKRIMLAISVVFSLLTLAIGSIVQGTDANQGNNTPISGGDIEWNEITVSAKDTQSGALVLVNGTVQYENTEKVDHLDAIVPYMHKMHPKTRPYQSTGVSEYMAADALVAMDKMLTAFVDQTGESKIAIHWAYRSAEDQETYGSSPVGYSDHHTGYGCSLRIMKDPGPGHEAPDAASYSWLSKNAAKYGFVVRYPADKADVTGEEDYTEYFRYVGIPHATLMEQKDLCMEEYVDYLSKNAAEGIEVTGKDGHTYMIYYYAVSGDTKIKVPTNCTYTVSGTNQGGVVVTVNLSAESETESASESASAQA